MISQLITILQSILTSRLVCWELELTSAGQWLSRNRFGHPCSKWWWEESYEEICFNAFAFSRKYFAFPQEICIHSQNVFFANKHKVKFLGGLQHDFRTYMNIWNNNHTDHFILGILRLHVWNSGAVKCSLQGTSVCLDTRDWTSVLVKLVSALQNRWLVFNCVYCVKEFHPCFS